MAKSPQTLETPWDAVCVPSVLERMTDGFASFDRQWRYIYVNAAAAKMLNKSPAELLGRCIWDVFPDLKFTRFYTGLHAALHEQRFVELEEYYEPHHCWYNCRCYPTEEGLAIIFVDVTERHQAAQFQAHLAAIVESSVDAIISKTCEGIITSWNPGAQLLYGYSPEEIIGQPIAVIVPDDRMDELAGIMRKINAGKRIEHFETVRKHKNGQLISVSLTASPICDARGKVVGASAIARNISAQKAAEAAIKRSASLMRLITDSVPVLIGYVDNDQRYVFVNRRYEEWFGQPRTALRGRTVRQVLGDEAYQTNARRIAAALSGKQQRFEMKLRRHDGVLQDVQVQYVPHVTENNRVSGFFVVVTDVSRLKRAEVEAAMLATSDNERRRMGQELHDTLIQSLAGAAMLAESLRQKLDGATDHAHSAQQIVNVIQDAQRQARRLERGLNPVEVDAGGLMNALDELAQQTSLRHQINCHFNCHTKVLVERNDVAMHLFRIAQEATHNAVKHAQASKIAISLTGNRVLRLSIHDNGRGFVPEASHPQGSGLRIMRYRAEAIGGKLKIESVCKPAPSNPGQAKHGNQDLGRADGGTVVSCTVKQRG